jgi:hypothetical protein
MLSAPRAASAQDFFSERRRLEKPKVDGGLSLVELFSQINDDQSA